MIGFIYPNGLALLEKNPEKINWHAISFNKNAKAIALIEKNLDKISWIFLSENPNAIHLLEKNLDKICWQRLCSNPNGLALLKQNQEHIHWYWLSTNPGIFKRVGLWTIIKALIKLLSLHQRAVVTANHPLRLLKRGEFEEI